MAHISVEDLEQAFAAASIGYIRPTYVDPNTGETRTALSQQCIGDTSGPHTPAPTDAVGMLGYIALIHESGTTEADLASALSDKVGGDSEAYDGIVAERESFRVELAARTLGWSCHDGVMTIKDPRDPDIVTTKIKYNGVGVTVREYFQNGRAAGATTYELAVALREYVGDTHEEPPVAPDTTAFDAIMGA